MRLFPFIIALALCCIACKPYQTTVMREQQITYDSFSQSQKSFSTPDGTISYIDKGQGPVIVLLHGVPTSGWLYRKMIDPLVDQGYRVVAPDMLGFGNSDSPKGYEVYSEDKHAERLLALMDHLNIDQWAHAMHDAGGLWTWELLERQPHRILSLIHI